MGRRSCDALRCVLAVLLCLVLAACSTGSDATKQVSGGAEAPAGTAAARENAGSVERRLQDMSADEANVRLVGRTYSDHGVRWLAQSGSAVEFRVEATYVELTLVGGDETDNDEDHRPRFAVLLDGDIVMDDTLGERARSVAVFDSETPRSAVVSVMLLSEAVRGAVGIKAISVEAPGENPVAPTAKKGMSVAFIGDSITCAYGVESSGTNEGFKTTTENFMKSYAYYTAQALDADYETASYSGYGIVSGWTGDGTKNEDMLLPPVYELVAEGCEETWDFSAHRHDAVVINLGTNDDTYTRGDEARSQEFAQAYTEFLGRVRECNPDAYIICTMGTMGHEELYPYVEQAVRDFQQKTGDERVLSYRSDKLDEQADGVGAHGHPTAKTQKKSADKLVQVIRQALA